MPAAAPDPIAPRMPGVVTTGVQARVLNRLGEDIVLGRYPRGGSLPPEPTLCEQLGVSRTVVREAVKSLVAKGLLVTGPKLGTRVLNDDQWNWFDPAVVAWQTRAGMTPDFLREVHELRRIIEPAAVAMAAQRATVQDIQGLEQAYEGMRLAVEGGGDYVLHDMAFHQGLLRACHNRMVGQMSKALEALLRTSFEISTARPHGPAGALPMHRAVLDAVIARQPAVAKRAALLLIDSAGEDIDQVLAARRMAGPAALAASPSMKPEAAVCGRHTVAVVRKKSIKEFEP